MRLDEQDAPADLADEAVAAFPRAFLGVAAILAATCTVVAIAQYALTPPTAIVRVCNSTGLALSDLELMGKRLGGLAPHAFSTTWRKEGAYREESVRATIGGERVGRQLEDHVGENPLAAGDYIYVVTLDAKGELRAVVGSGRNCRAP